MKFLEWLQSPAGLAAASGIAGVISAASGNPSQQQVGYTGGIPERNAVRAAVERDQLYQPGRRPGSGGRRYFSNTQYAKNADTPAVQAATINEATALGNWNRTNPYNQLLDPSNRDQILAWATKTGRDPAKIFEDIQARIASGAVTGQNSLRAAVGGTTAKPATSGIASLQTPPATRPAAASQPAPISAPVVGVSQQDEFLSAAPRYDPTYTDPNRMAMDYWGPRSGTSAAPPAVNPDVLGKIKGLLSTAPVQEVQQSGPDTQGVMTDRGITGAKTGTVLQEGPWAGVALSGGEDPVQAFMRANNGIGSLGKWAMLSQKGVTPDQYDKSMGASAGTGQSEMAALRAQYGDKLGFRRGGKVARYAHVGIAGAAPSRYLAGPTDGMADKIPTSIDGKEPAALSHGEYVITADDVSHLGNGNSTAGAKVLDEMVARIRKARTGSPEQGRRINPNKLVAA